MSEREIDLTTDPANDAPMGALSLDAYLALEVLGARRRAGTVTWTFPESALRALDELRVCGYVQHKPSPNPGHVTAWLTDDGAATVNPGDGQVPRVETALLTNAANYLRVGYMSRDALDAIDAYITALEQANEAIYSVDPDPFAFCRRETHAGGPDFCSPCSALADQWVRWEGHTGGFVATAHEIVQFLRQRNADDERRHHDRVAALEEALHAMPRHGRSLDEIMREAAGETMPDAATQAHRRHLGYGDADEVWPRVHVRVLADGDEIDVMLPALPARGDIVELGTRRYRVERRTLRAWLADTPPYLTLTPCEDPR